MATNVQQGSNPASNPMALSNDVLHLAIANKLIRYLLTKGVELINMLSMRGKVN